MSVSELLKVANKKDTNNFGGAAYENEDLREALLAVAGAGGAISAQRLGNWLGAKKGRIVEGRFVEKVGLFEGVVQWRLSQKR